MKTTSLKDLEHHLDKLGLSRRTETLIIHASLVSFGKIEAKIEDILTLISSKIAKNATIFVPTFTLNLKEDDPFDVKTTPSYGMGALAEYIRQKPEAVRANNPMHSYAGIGPNARILKSATETLSFGKNSCFERMLNLKPDLLLLGCPFHHGATHIHQNEAEIGVPYRIWLSLKRTVTQPSGNQEKITFRYYGIENGDKVKWSPEKVLKRLEDEQKLKECKLPYGKSYFVTLSDLDLTARNVLQEDNNALNLLA